MRVLLVTGSQHEAAWLHNALIESAHSLERVHDLKDAIFLAGQELFDAVIVMSTESPPFACLLAALPRLASESRGAPIIVTLGAARAKERTQVLRAGGDACFCQPLSFIELHERMHALRRVSPVAVQRMGQVSVCPALDTGTREFVCGERRLHLTRREYMLLECLLRQPNIPVSRSDLIRYAWPDQDDVAASSVNLVISRLRRKLAPHYPDINIDTLKRYGYQLTLMNA
ncbi:response regulator transcription factor [Paraburkholderia rhynchosiae]|uniref:DNA-binding response regulator n=1 Tax=Paraburkholderia rhynchosiae TaxID=487049 RepID=A0A2N7WDF7_9BURK|nr:response regulator transcription factor [Paraburkholderia rhynchosiae]PMS27438.1 DNA-binding response regulator [Paraburkholderia rhynchosiae]CAB3724516.1 Transcriptional regulatory protein tctD [Paraburkholderia rhynchosiae]